MKTKKKLKKSKKSAKKAKTKVASKRPAGKVSAAKGRWVYAFGGGKAEGRTDEQINAFQETGKISSETSLIAPIDGAALDAVRGLHAPPNAAIAGHRTTYGAPFGDLDQLQIGDLIEVGTLAGIRVGATVEPSETTDASYASTLTTHFGSVTPENALKWYSVQNTRGTFISPPFDISAQALSMPKTQANTIASSSANTTNANSPAQ